MAGANELTVFIDANTSGLQQGLQQAENQVRSFQDRIQGIADIGQKLTGLGAVMTAGLTVPIIGLATASVKAYGEIQSLQKGLEAVMGSASLASAEFNKLKEVAKLPGLGMQEAVKGSINLQSIGISAEKSRDILQQFGNAVATVGKGRAEFESAIYGVQQLANTDFPLGEDLNIIKDALPQVSNLLKEAFGSSRSDELANMGVSSKQVLDVILTGLGKLPRVSGGIKGAFENLSDAIQTYLGRIGKVIDDNLNISGLIDKLTNSLDKLISGFEDLSPAMQNTVIVLTGLAGATGPVLLGIGGIMAVVPLVVDGFKAIKTAVEALTASMLRNPYTAIAVALAAIATAVYVYYSSLETGKDRQERFNDSLAKATLQAKNEVSELQKLYAASQDQNKSLDERNKAVDQLQKQYPAYFANLSNEAILAGKAGEAYKNLTVDIFKASRARAAQSELDARNAKRLEKELVLQKKLRDALSVFYSDSPDAVIKFNQSNPFDGIDAREGVKAGAKKYIKGILSEISNEYKSALKEDKEIKRIIEEGINPISKLDSSGTDNFVKTVTSNNEKLKNETQKQLSEIYSTGSIAELRQRAELLIKAIETSNNDIVKIRGLDKFGNDKTKQGLPIYTGEIIAREEAYKRLEQINAQIDLLEPPKLKEIDSSALVRFRDNFSIQSTSLNLELTNGFTETERLINKASSGIKTEYLKLDGISDLLQKYYPKNSIEWYQAEIEKLNKLKEQAEVGTEAWRKLNDEIDKYNAKLGGKKQDGLTGIGNALREESNLISNETFNISNNLTNFANNTTDIFNKVKESLKKASLAESYKNLLASLSQIASENAVNAISDVFTSLGTAISNGTSVIDVVGKSLLGSFGKLLSEFGKQLIQYGIGLIVVKKAIQNPYLAIAAGAALVALGAGLTASVNKTVENSGIGGSGGVSSSTGSSASTNYSSSYSNTNTGSGGEVVFRISGPDLIGAINRNVISADRLNSN